MNQIQKIFQHAKSNFWSQKTESCQYEKCQRKKIKIMSVNQIALCSLQHITGGLQYNETFILWANPQDMDKHWWKEIFPEKYYKENRISVPEKPKLKCLGFTYNESKLFNMMPIRMRETKIQNARSCPAIWITVKYCFPLKSL